MAQPESGLTIERCDAAIRYLAECVLVKDERHAADLDRMIEVVAAERERLARRQDPRARARAILAQTISRPAA